MQFLDKRRNPFFEHAEAEYFIAYRDGEPVGRISAHIDEDLNEFHDNRWGLFGFFECTKTIPRLRKRCSRPPKVGYASADVTA